MTLHYALLDLNLNARLTLNLKCALFILGKAKTKKMSLFLLIHLRCPKLLILECWVTAVWGCYLRNYLEIGIIEASRLLNSNFSILSTYLHIYKWQSLNLLYIWLIRFDKNVPGNIFFSPGHCSKACVLLLPFWSVMILFPSCNGVFFIIKYNKVNPSGQPWLP